MKIWLKRIFYLLLLVLALLIVFNFSLIGYGIGQARGQFEVIWNAKSIKETLADPDFPDSLKQNLLLVEDIKRFAIDSLGLKPTKNYSTVYDQQGQDILWVVTACEPYEFKPRMWSFPVIGSFSYKGFFELEKAKQLAKELKSDSLDVHVRSVGGWSTLGWFKDPILSNMLTDSPGELANTIIHELTHGTLFIPDSMTFNENLATFIGNEGAKEFLNFKYGQGSEEYQSYVAAREDSKKFTRYIVRQVKSLDSLYKNVADSPDSIKRRQKQIYIEAMIAGLRDIEFNQSWYKDMYSNYRPNNAYFISFLDYRERQDEFDSLYLNQHNNNLAEFINSWKTLYSN